jgi:hypothetical protein
MFKFNVVGSIVGIILMGGFLGFLGWWLKSWPLSIIILLVLGLMLYDVAKGLKEIRDGNGSA